MKTLNTAILVMVFSVRAFSYNNDRPDSLGIENMNGRIYVIHKVSPDETLYRLLKKYNCTSGEVLNANPILKSNNIIKSGQIIKFPIKGYTANKEEIKVAETKPIMAPDKIEEPIVVATPIIEKSLLKHTVNPGETLYSIARSYNLSVPELKSLNNILDTDIKIGQTILVRNMGNVAEKPTRTYPPALTDIPRMTVPNAPTGKKVSELGIAEVINTDHRSSKYLALHRSAPVGSLISVKNEATGDKILVKVIGKLPETGNNHDVVIRLSPSAFQKLRPRDSRIRAEVVYTLAPLNHEAK